MLEKIHELKRLKRVDFERDPQRINCTSQKVKTKGSLKFFTFSFWFCHENISILSNQHHNECR